VVSAYPSFESFSHDLLGVDTGEPKANAQPLSPTAIFGWQFFVPESGDCGEDEDRRLLAKAIKLARKTEFVEMRGDFYMWWSDVVKSGMATAEAKADMEKRITEYQKLMKVQGWKTAFRYGIKVAEAFSGPLGLVKEVASKGAEFFLVARTSLATSVSKRQRPPAPEGCCNLP
jgi:hypothetical protein